MELIHEIFGKGESLTIWQMGARGIGVFFVALILIRISGRRSFGIGTALDNIIIILLGAILGRAVVGASPVLPCLLTSLIIVCMHRVIALLVVRSKWLRRLIEGSKIIVYKDGSFIFSGMARALVTEEDIRQAVRKTLNTESLSQVDTIFMERNGELSVVRKEG